MGECGKCCFWGNNRNFNCDKNAKLKSCNCPKMLYGYHVDKDEVIDNDIALIEDDEGWGMLTSKFFGCIHFTMITNTPKPL